jgi:hypothetical protein
MKTSKFFWLFFVIAIVFGLSSYFSANKLKALRTPQSVVSIPGCKVQPDFIQLKSELGKIVNVQELRERNVPQFLRLINDFRLKSGLPLPVLVSTAKLEKEKAVYNNCRSTCQGSVHEVFAVQVEKARNLQVLLADGSLKSLPLHESGLELASIDELNKKGIPFRSWLAPVSEGDWYISGNNLYYRMDIQGLWLKIDTASRWEVVANPPGTSRLNHVDEPLSVPGCNLDEDCLESQGRHFKAPRICQK